MICRRADSALHTRERYKLHLDAWANSISRFKERTKQIHDYVPYDPAFRSEGNSSDLYLTRRVETYEQELQHLKGPRASLSYRSCIEHIAPQQRLANRRWENHTQAWERVFEKELNTALATRSGALWDRLQPFLSNGDSQQDARGYLQAEARDLYGELSKIIHNFTPLNEGS